MKRVFHSLSYFRELWLWPLIAILAGLGLIELVRGSSGRSPADDIAELFGVALSQSPIFWAAIAALALDGHLYWSLTREEWINRGRPIMDSFKPIFVFTVILIFEYFYLRH